MGCIGVIFPKIKKPCAALGNICQIPGIFGPVLFLRHLHEGQEDRLDMIDGCDQLSLLDFRGIIQLAKGNI